MSSEEIEQLREKLRQERHGRIESISATSGDPGTISASNHREERSVLSDVSGSGGKTESDNATNNDTQRSIDKEPYGERSSSRRYGKDYSSTFSSETINGRGKRRKSGKLITDDDIPERKPDQEEITEPIKSRATRTANKRTVKETKETDSKQTPISLRDAKENRTIRETGFKIKKPEWISQGKTLNETEVIQLHAPLKTFLDGLFNSVDEYIWYQTKDTTQMPVWSNVDDDELDVLARVILKQGQKSVLIANSARYAAGSNDYINSAKIVAPRAWLSYTKLKNAPKNDRISFLQRKRLHRGNES